LFRLPMHIPNRTCPSTRFLENCSDSFGWHKLS
jgi:hypothetical protein